jgi:hypothetical protein
MASNCFLNAGDIWLMKEVTLNPQWFRNKTVFRQRSWRATTVRST